MFVLILPISGILILCNPHSYLAILLTCFLYYWQVKPMMKNQKEDKSEKKGTKKKADKGANKLGAAQAAS